jgi:hypothetical protein
MPFFLMQRLKLPEKTDLLLSGTSLWPPVKTHPLVWDFEGTIKT